MNESTKFASLAPRGAHARRELRARATGAGLCALCLCLFPSAPSVAQEPPAQEAHVAPPEPIHRVDAVYPPKALAARQEATSVLLVTIGVDGMVSEVGVAESGGDAFDQAAIAAVRRWRFRPARRGGRPIPSRIRVPFQFTLPKVEPAPRTPPAQGSAAEELAAADEPKEEQPLEVEVRGRRPPPARSTSDFVLDREVLTVAPHQDAASAVMSAPGVYVARPEGDAVAHQIFLRGFDAEHGQDIEFTLNGWFPVNQPSHIHGQGYADLNFIIPELIRSVRVTEGVYDPRQGDFAVAGSVDFDLGVAQRGYQLRSSYGSFGTFRQLVLWAPEGESEETFGAAVFRLTGGFGTNRGGMSGGVIGQYAFKGPGGFNGLVHVGAHGARANIAGVLRLDDVEAGRTSRVCCASTTSRRGASGSTAPTPTLRRTRSRRSAPGPRRE